MSTSVFRTCLILRDYDLGATLESGQAFRWRRRGDAWVGMIGQRPVRLDPAPDGWTATTSAPPVPGGTAAFEAEDWVWLRDYLQSEVDLETILTSFPNDGPMRASTAACRGLRLLRQDPWECLASFICSSTKQIVQIQQIIELLCARFGERVDGVEADVGALAYTFPTPERVASLQECELRDCKMGFRAPYVAAAAKAVADGQLDLTGLGQVGYGAALAKLTELPGVGEKIANCVLLFAYGYPEAFPVDVWVMKALRELYFPKRRPSPARLRQFVASYFGPNAGYAQQYLFHYMRTRAEGK